VAISPLQAKYSKQLVSKHNLSFPLLLDSGNYVADLFGIRHVLPEKLQELYTNFGLDLPRFNGDASWSLPMPARYVVDKEGIVRDRSVSADYTVRPNPEETLDLLKTL
jgi:peroxiredoxin